MRIPRLLALIAPLAVASSCFAWIDTGHMVIAEIAFERVRPEVRAELIRLSKLGGTAKNQGFVMGACWADDTKNRETGPWHYMDIFFRADGKPTDLKAPPENVVWAIAKFSKILANRSAPDAERADALRYLTHFVGDSHQPLHSVARITDAFPEGDRGGNDFKIVAPGGLNLEPRNLHFLWDMGCGIFQGMPRPLTPDGTAQIKAMARAIQRKFPEKGFVREMNEMNPMEWAQEGLLACRTLVYDLQPDQVPSAEYLKKGQLLAEKKSALAGYRLAKLLNHLLSKDEKPKIR